MKIGILQTGHVPEELAETGGYPAMFERLLAGQGFAFETYAVVDGAFPDSAAACDGWLITGSRHGAYEDHPWIAPLEDFIRAAYDARVPMVGVCFGHQIIAQALGGAVEKFAGGWSVGRQAYELAGETVMQNAWHQDQVTAKPEQAEVVGRSAYCEYAALLYGDRAFSVQWHPEFESDFIEALIRLRGRGTVPDALLAQAEATLEMDNDNARLAEAIGTFFRERRLV